jgi:hypothetical protein
MVSSLIAVGELIKQEGARAVNERDSSEERETAGFSQPYPTDVKSLFNGLSPIRESDS